MTKQCLRELSDTKFGRMDFFSWNLQWNLNVIFDLLHAWDLLKLILIHSFNIEDLGRELICGSRYTRNPPNFSHQSLSVVNDKMLNQFTIVNDLRQQINIARRKYTFLDKICRHV